MIWFYYLLMALFLIVGLLLNLMTLPGLWLMVAAVGAYAWATHFLYVSWPGVITLIVMATIAEIIELFAGSAGAKAAGGSRRGMLGALLGGLAGGIVGGILLSFIPVLGTIVGVCLGTFIGAVIVELLLVGKPTAHSLRIGYSATKGRVYGMVIKTVIGLIMMLTALIICWS